MSVFMHIVHFKNRDHTKTGDCSYLTVTAYIRLFHSRPAATANDRSRLQRLGVPWRQPHHHSGLSTLPSV